MKKKERQQKAIIALANSGGSVTEAARTVGVNRRTLYNYLSEPWFVREVQKAFNGGIIEAASASQGMKMKAQSVVMELMENSDPGVRLKAARVALEYAAKNDETCLKVFQQYRKDYEDPFGIFS